jgi:choice-of-anchor B domain-containing protein
VAGAQSQWREMKTYSHYAYVVTEGGGGLLIIDLANLPTSETHTFFTPTITVNGQTNQLGSAHTVWVDEKGFLYLMGTDIQGASTLIFDLKPNPAQPTYVGATVRNGTYVHDAFSRGDTLWEANINAGYFSVYNITNRANPQFITTQATPQDFTHNTWLSDDSNTLFTTDERANSWIAAYDITDLTDIKELDRWRRKATEGTGVIIHNVHIKNDFAIAAHYTDGVSIVDAHKPDNLVEVGNFDSYTGTSTGFNGCWEAYPYFPSGRIILSDINTGLWVLQPTYKRACYLEGNVKDTITNANLNGVLVEILSTAENELSATTGDYKMGYVHAGTYSVRFSKAGYRSKTVSAVLTNGQITNLNVKLYPLTNFSLTGKIQEKISGQGISNSKIYLKSDLYEYTATADANGNFSLTGVYPDVYDVFTGQWGYLTKFTDNQNILTGSSSLLYELDKGYRDEFELDLGWTVSGTAATGDWERVIPIGVQGSGSIATLANDVTNDNGIKCYLTGNNNQGSVGGDDVDDGNVLLSSPIFNTSTMTTPTVSFSYHFANFGGNSTPNDTLKIYVLKNGSKVYLDKLTLSTTTWITKTYSLNTFTTPAANLRLVFETADNANTGHVVEAMIDYVSIYDAANVGVQTTLANDLEVKTYPVPFKENFRLTADISMNESWTFSVYNSLGQLIEQENIHSQNSILLGEKWLSGVYFIHIQTNSGKRNITKVVKD